MPPDYLDEGSEAIEIIFRVAAAAPGVRVGATSAYLCSQERSVGGVYAERRGRL